MTAEEYYEEFMRGPISKDMIIKSLQEFAIATLDTLDTRLVVDHWCRVEVRDEIQNLADEI